MVQDPQAQRGQIPGSRGAPYVVVGNQWVGYDDVNYVIEKASIPFTPVLSLTKIDKFKITISFCYVVLFNFSSGSRGAVGQAPPRLC